MFFPTLGIMQEKSVLQKKSAEAELAIKDIIARNRQDFENSIGARKKALKETFNKYIPALDMEIMGPIRNELKRVNHVAMTSDGWSSNVIIIIRWLNF